MILPWYARLALRVIAALALVILYGPLLLTVFFRSSTSAATACSGAASACIVRALLENRGIVQALGNTMLVGAATVVCAVLLGTLLAFWYHAHPGEPAACCRRSSSCRSSCRRS